MFAVGLLAMSMAILLGIGGRGEEWFEPKEGRFWISGKAVAGLMVLAGYLLMIASICIALWRVLP